MRHEETLNEHYYVDRGMHKFFMKDYHGAIEDYTKALELNAEGPVAFMRGMAYLELNRKQEAHADFEKAKQSGIHIPDDFWARSF